MNLPTALTCAPVSRHCHDLLRHSPVGCAVHRNAHHRRLAREHHFTVALPLDEAFTFFEPVGEKRWADGWRPLFLSTEDAALARRQRVYGHHARTAGKRNRPCRLNRVPLPASPQQIEYRNVLIGLRATWIVVNCEAAGDNATKVTVRYVYHGLSEAGDAFIASMTQEKFEQMIESWSDAVAAYLVRRTPASP